ncbi:uncharacterized protein LOC132717934 [Ruditapes philippinarum]|uniref:uncharacterized protein LOC132717934 n=1 Tax=Ruditapes philippinarum TaxID=129788 RepID=UPI00295C33A6|nr:uncharacterized protein LOC132717934 [Ruditapes philippinarum]
MSENIQAGYLYFLSEKFDNNFRHLASPIKVAFISGVVVGFAAGCLTMTCKDKLWDTLSALKRSLTKSPAIPMQPLDGTFEVNKNEILQLLTNIFRNGNGRFNRLRQDVGCTEEIAENNIESLMINVSRNLMTDYKPEFGIANFFANVVKFVQTEQDIEQATLMELEKKANELTRLCFEKDILMIHGEGDSELAQNIKTGVEKWNIKMDLESEVGIGQTVFSSLNDAFDKYMFVFVIVTINLKKDGIRQYLCEGQLLESLCEKKGRLVPVQIEGNQENNPVYRVIKPWKYKNDQSINNLVALVQKSTQMVFPSIN